MADPLSLAVLSGTALTEGIHFLYDQAGAALERRRERRETPRIVAEPKELAAPDEQRVAALEEQLRTLREDVHEPSLSREEMLWHADALRAVLESVYGTRLVFAGEDRPATDVFSNVDVEQVRGYVAAIRADSDITGRLEARVRAQRVEQGGTVIGVDLRRGSGNE